MAPLDPVAIAPGSDTLLQILNLYRLDFVGQVKTKYSGIKIELAIERTLNIFCLPETMLLALERHVRHGQIILAQRLDHHLCLIRWNDFVFQSLEENYRT